jgi:hypothetical protein
VNQGGSNSDSDSVPKQTVITNPTNPNTDNTVNNNEVTISNELIPGQPISTGNSSKPQSASIIKSPQYTNLDFMNDPNLLKMFYVDLFNLDQERIPKKEFFLMYLIIENLLQDYSRKNGIGLNSLSNPQMVAIIITLLDLGKELSK